MDKLSYEMQVKINIQCVSAVDSIYQRYQQARVKPDQIRLDPTYESSSLQEKNLWMWSGGFEVLMSAYGSKHVKFVLHFQPLFRAYW